MIDSVNSSNLTYIPASRPATGMSASEPKEQKELQSQSSQPISYSQSLNGNGSAQASQLPSKNDDNNNEREVKSAESDAKAQEASQKEQIQQVVAQLKARDREVRVHEQAHLSAAGSFAMGGMSLSYQRGPDGQQYAIGGSVQIDTSPVSGDPEATIQKGRVVQQAALAPAEPSGQDRKVASAASQMISDAQAQIAKQAQEERALKESERAEESEGAENGLSEKSDNVSKPLEVSSSAVQADDYRSSQGVDPMAVAARMQFDVRMQVSAN